MQVCTGSIKYLPSGVARYDLDLVLSLQSFGNGFGDSPREFTIQPFDVAEIHLYSHLHLFFNTFRSSNVQLFYNATYQ